MNLTKEQEEQLLTKLRDRNWRLDNLYYIINEKGEKIPYRANTIQRRIREERKSRKAFILKYRQGGVSTEKIIDLVDDFAFGGTNRNNYFVTHKRELLDVFFKKAKQIYDDIDKSVSWILPPLTLSNANEMYCKRMNNTLRITLDPRGTTPSKLHISEFAFRTPEEQKELFIAMNEFRETETTIETTANGVGDTAYLLAMEAKQGLGEYQLMFYPFHIEERNEIDATDFIPTEEEENLYTNHLKEYGYDKAMRKLAWRRMKIETNNAMGEDGIKKFHQENPITIEEAFVSSGSTVFDLDKKDTWKIQDKLFTEEGINFFIEEGDNISVGIDMAEGGVRGDYSAFTGRLPDGRVAFQYKGRVNEVVLARKIDHVMNMEKNGKKRFACFLIPENNVGLAFINECKHYDWFNYVVKEQKDNVADDYNDGVVQKYGFRTTKTSKDLIIREFRSAIYNKSIYLTKETIAEIMTYQYDKSNSANAIAPNHDDVLMSDMIALYGVLHINFNVERTEEEIDYWSLSPMERHIYRIKNPEYEPPEEF